MEFKKIHTYKSICTSETWKAKLYNNNKTCPYDNKCALIHEESKPCKYGVICEHNYCMFKHLSKDKMDNLKNLEFDPDEKADNDYSSSACIYLFKCQNHNGILLQQTCHHI